MIRRTITYFGGTTNLRHIDNTEKENYLVVVFVDPPVLVVSIGKQLVGRRRHLVDLRSVSSVYRQSQAEVSRVDWTRNR